MKVFLFALFLVLLTWCNGLTKDITHESTKTESMGTDTMSQEIKLCDYYEDIREECKNYTIYLDWGKKIIFDKESTEFYKTNGVSEWLQWYIEGEKLNGDPEMPMNIQTFTFPFDGKEARIIGIFFEKTQAWKIIFKNGSFYQLSGDEEYRIASIKRGNLRGSKIETGLGGIYYVWNYTIIVEPSPQSVPWQDVWNIRVE